MEIDELSKLFAQDYNKDAFARFVWGGRIILAGIVYDQGSNLTWMFSKGILIAMNISSRLN